MMSRLITINHVLPLGKLGKFKYSYIEIITLSDTIFLLVFFLIQTHSFNLMTLIIKSSPPLFYSNKVVVIL